MIDKDFYKKQLKENLIMMQNDQNKYGHLTVYEYLENLKLEIIRQYEILINSLDIPVDYNSLVNEINKLNKG